MADMNMQQSSNRKGTSSKKLSTRVDMTSMVDLGFLLITFFMLTTTLSKPNTLDLIMPADGPSMPVSASKSLTILLGGDNKLMYYEGDNPQTAKLSSYANTLGIGDVIRAKKEAVAAVHGSDTQLMVMIKASKDANYKNYVDIMDELLINKVARYATVDITNEETTLLH
ncbi:biopolymer transport protein ExbD [Chitinophaga skermanii]|uniref:Biopolymer transport protein ExbD n=1 Tax=Chitinophaga skermanii TaxID=331697 RepID=A0A327R3V5_9BACT|nr:biopolymer transporter ExbD [Chitinophaga skermanii]RAJ10423.1 biopolymer transport protein ExbD [Chitinophaga skermanii]